MGYKILKGNNLAHYSGCNFVVKLSEDRLNSAVKILQLTDTQIIDSTQIRKDRKLSATDAFNWRYDNFSSLCGNYVSELVSKTKPDLIIITGDLVHGAYDDSGKVFKGFCEFINSFKTPWAVVFGNHDNESRMGVSWQCSILENSQYCLFQRGNVEGNSNYSIGIAVGNALIRVIHMVDTNGCYKSEDESVIKKPGIYPSQLNLINKTTKAICNSQGRLVPSFMACHIPVSCFIEAEKSKNYLKLGRETYVIGETVTAKNNDFGAKLECYEPVEVGGEFINFLHENNIEGVFVGHAHYNSFCIEHEKIKWVFGLKTGEYDYFYTGKIGGTLITLEGNDFTVEHVYVK